MIGYGCVDSSIEKIESVAEIKKRIEKGIEIFDPRIMLLDPDCGMRMRSRDVAFEKLKRMAEAAKMVRIGL
jgi:5-methyltetrahydropteroyltriglutamate--homocysteine methyltransferase